MKRRSVIAVILTTLVYACAGSSSAPQRQTQPSSPPERTDPLHSLTLMRQGSILLQQEQYHEALERFQEADRSAPGNATVHNMIGLCHLKLGQYDQALAAFNRSLELVPSFTDARNNRGATYLALEQYRLAEVDFMAVLGDSTYPHRWQVYYNLGMTYLQRGQLAAAAENFRRAITAPSPVFEAYLRAAEVASLQGDDEEAVGLLEEAQLRFPERLEVPLRLGRLLVELGRGDEARPLLQDVIAREPDSDWAREAASLLDSG